MEFRVTLLVLTLGLPFLPVNGQTAQPPECPPHMHYDTCDTSCPITCQNYKCPPKACNMKCNGRCACDEGYILLSEGSSTCVKKDQCPVNKGLPFLPVKGKTTQPPSLPFLPMNGQTAQPPKCPPNMHFDTCDTSCPITCQNYRFPPMVCNLKCNARCACDEGYILLSEGSSTCVKKDQCPVKGLPFLPVNGQTAQPPKCPPKMHFAPCDGSCPITCQNYQSPPEVCTMDCNPGCACDEGYILLSEGSSTCVKKDQCPVSKALPFLPLNGQTAQPPSLPFLPVNGQTAQPPKCPPNMHFDTCDTSCPITCQNYRFPPMVCNLKCNARCACDEGYILLSEGSSTCVKKDQCPVSKGLPFLPVNGQTAQPPKCPPNMHFDTCDTSCPITCDNYQSPHTFCNLKCNARCACDEGYILLSEGSSTCVKKDQCSVNKGLPFLPVNGQIAQPPTLPFLPVNGQIAQLPKCPPNMHFAPCDGSCPITCQNYQSPPEVCTMDCNPGCACDEGYILLSEGSSTCVKKDQCPVSKGLPFLPVNGQTAQPPKCPPNMHFDTCDTSCPITCQNYRFPPMVCNLKCNARCACDEGYILLSEGSSTCVKKDQCPVSKGLPFLLMNAQTAQPPKCPPNMHFDTCDTSCPITCDNYQSPPTFCNLKCNTRCACDEGYILLSEGSSTCVKKDQCPVSKGLPFLPVNEQTAQPPKCPPNMHFDTCDTSCPITCQNYRFPPMVCNLKCNARCACDEGYILLSEGSSTCVKKDQCPVKGLPFLPVNIQTAQPPKCPPNMHFDTCDTSCPITCDNYQSPHTFCDLKCNARCACDEGYILLSEGSSTCVKKDQCPVSKGLPFLPVNGKTAQPPKCPPNMHFDTCDTSCPITCDNYQSPPTFCNLKCNDRCVCDEGYILLSEGSSTCVKKDQCPVKALPFLPVKGKTTQPPSCPYNMHYDMCGTACPLTCDNYREPLICTKDCKTGCFCNDGFVQLSNGSSICVEKNQCPVCKELGCEGKHREYKKCGSACPKNCANSNKPPACIKICVQGCFCKDKYLSNSNGDCVPVKDC
ncbi:zonadhesin-like isoform X2 [Ascaphus truei]|uniref:zonadhesin-like isoform X2 n=1 Tax=Ascaphus truei TaxID=8439 RepID=UPI003F5AC476